MTQSPLKILVFGSRDWVRRDTIYRVLSKLPTNTILVHGAARGADRLSGWIGESLGFDVRPYPISNEEWGEYKGFAGPRRNAIMLEKEHPCEDGIFISKGFGFSLSREDKGTSDMANKLWVAKIRHEIFFPPKAA